MNIKSSLSILLISSAFLASCKKELQPQDNSAAVSTAAAGTTAVNPPIQAQQPQVQPASNTVLAAGINPPHGQPNHRCDIAVGAPLNSAGTPAGQATVQSSVGKPTTTQPQSAKTAVVAAGMNPPHGQPNHRCDIAVGAPLNSPVAANKSLARAVPTDTPQAANFQPTTVTASTTPPVMNPPHGQEGHSCAVAVGAPLPPKSE